MFFIIGIEKRKFPFKVNYLGAKDLMYHELGLLNSFKNLFEILNIYLKHSISLYIYISFYAFNFRLGFVLYKKKRRSVIIYKEVNVPHVSCSLFIF